MRIERALVSIVCLSSFIAAGCSTGRLAYNLPPSSRLMEPGPGVGGPGPGVIPPAGYPNGMYGGAVGRFGDGMGGYMGGGGDCAQCAPPEGNFSPAQPGPNGVVQASYRLPGDCPPGCGGACSCGAPYCPLNGACGMGGGGPCGCGPCAAGGMRPGMSEAYADGGAGAGAGMATSQVAFLGEEGIQISWDVSGYGMFDASPLVVPGRQDFLQGAIYRLRLTNIPGRAGVELFPTLEIAPVTPRTDAFLAHSPIPVQFTEEDFDQVLSGNFVTKVVYLPDPEFQELALAGVETLVSTRLDPGVDPIAEADRRGSILAILRIGNKDLRRGMGTSAPAEYQPQEMIPASHVAPAGYTEASNATGGSRNASQANQAVYQQEMPRNGQPTPSGVLPAQYCSGGPGYACGPYGDGAMANMPLGMPTSGFAPQPMPPNMIAGAPQWGMPITGTPIGLPGPPHVPLGVPAGLQKHVMTNRTRYDMPPPVAKVQMTVKQRPGLNYPTPVSRVHVNETQREPFGAGEWLSNLFHRRQAGQGNCGPYAGCGPDTCN